MFFFFFSVSGEGKGGCEVRRGGVGFFKLKIPGRGGEREGGGRGAGRVSTGNSGGGGLNIFFRGRNYRQDLLHHKSLPRPGDVLMTPVAETSIFALLCRGCN